MITKYQGHQLNQVNHGSDIGEGAGGVGGWKECKLRDITSKIGSGATPTGGGNAYKSESLFLIRKGSFAPYGSMRLHPLI